MSIPAPVLQALSSDPAGRLVLVLGAGCSVEQPTGLPLAREVAIEAHRLLVADEVLGVGDCTDPEDLSVVADAVFEATDSVKELVTRMPVPRMKTAQPNEGYLVAAALLREGLIRSVLTLNFDLAISNALVLVDGSDVAQVHSPADTAGLADPCVIYLHRSAFVPAEEWVLRSAQLAEDWGAWEGVIAARVLATPVVLFAGLGSPALVLTETIARVRAAVPDGVRTYQADIATFGSSPFAEALELTSDDYIQAGWCDLMRQLGMRVATEQIADIRREADRLVSDDGVAAVDFSQILSRLENLGLVGIGRVRANWTTTSSTYRPALQTDHAHIADIVLGVASVAEELAALVEIGECGVVEFVGDGERFRVLFLSGEGRRGHVGLQAAIADASLRERPDLVVLSALRDGALSPDAVSPPQNLVALAEEGSLVDGPGHPAVARLDDLRNGSVTLGGLLDRKAG